MNKNKFTIPNELKDPIKVEAVLIRETKDAMLLDCEGDVEWFPKKHINFDAETETLEVERWILQEKFPKETY